MVTKLTHLKVVQPKDLNSKRPKQF